MGKPSSARRVPREEGLACADGWRAPKSNFSLVIDDKKRTAHMTVDKPLQPGRAEEKRVVIFEVLHVVVVVVGWISNFFAPALVALVLSRASFRSCELRSALSPEILLRSRF